MAPPTRRPGNAARLLRGSDRGYEHLYAQIPSELWTRALTHDAEFGTGTPMLMARSGHASVRSLAKYARVSAEALQRHQAEHDPARRR
jgi:hypothetical protein